MVNDWLCEPQGKPRLPEGFLHGDESAKGAEEVSCESLCWGECFHINVNNKNYSREAGWVISIRKESED